MQKSEIDGIEINYRPATISDTPKFRSVWQEAFGKEIFGGGELYDRYLQWAFSQSPEIKPTSITQWVGAIDEDIIAVWTTVPETLVVNGESIEIVWLQAAATANRARRKGVARSIFKTIVRNNKLTLGVGVVDAARALYVSEGAHFVRADRFGILDVSLYSQATTVLRSLKRRKFADAVDVTKGLATRLTKLLKDTNPSRLVISCPEKFSPNINEFLASLNSSFPVMIKRTSEKLNWAISNPRYSSKNFVIKQNGKICGYAIVRTDGMILDFLVDPNEFNSFSLLMEFIRKWAKKEGIPSLRGIIPAQPNYNAYYQSTGFRILNEVDFGLFYSLTELSKNHPTLDNPENWYLSLIDSDLWSFQLPKNQG